MPSSKHILTFVFTAFLFLATITLEQRISAQKGTWVDPPRETPQAWSPGAVKIVSFGILPAVVDWLWIRAIQDPAYAHVLEGTRAPAYYDIDLATKLDPAFYLGYWAGGSILAIVRDDVEGARRILEWGEKFRTSELLTWSDELIQKHWPNQWQMLILLGYIYTFELKNISQGIKYYRAATLAPGAGASLQRIGAQLELPDGVYIVGKRVLKSLYDQSKERNDPIEAQEKIARQYKSIEVGHFIFNLNLEWQKEKIKTTRSFREFLSRKNITGDMYQGKLFLGKDGKIDTTTERDRMVMGIQS